MSRGKIKNIVEDKGYGFIRGDDGRDIFFHRSDLQGVDFKDIKEGDPVDFNVRRDPRGSGLRAVNVRRVGV